MNKPNVIIIYADDLGYGDVSCYGAEDIQTPNVDKLLDHGTKFYNGYTTSSVCTPARYSLLTGNYPFRNKGTKILPGDADSLISRDTNTLPKVMQQGGYRTAVIGKWHLGLGEGKLDWNKEINLTPNDLGFDYSFIFPATNDRVPCVYLKNRNILNLDPNDPIEVIYNKQQSPFDDIDTYDKNPEKLRRLSTHGHNHSIVNGVGRVGYMRGGNAALWKDEDLAERFSNEAKEFMDESGDQPFFIFYALHQPHVPRLPNEKFAGKSKLGPRGDVILELDWCVGQIQEHLKKIGKLDDTIIIFSSDNGPVLDDGYVDGAREMNGVHSAAGGLRGNKYTKFEGGARVPFIISWHNHIKKGSTDAILSQVDFMASFADMLGVPLADCDALDSQNFIDLILGKSNVGRTEAMFESVHKCQTLSTQKWAYLQPIGDGPAFTHGSKVETGITTEVQLFNLQYDRSQSKNVAANYPEVVAELDKRLNEILSAPKTR